MVSNSCFGLLFVFIAATVAIEGINVENEIGHLWPQPYDNMAADFPLYDTGFNDYNEGEDSRVKKGEGSAKSKYNPSLKWIGLGKKRSPSPIWSLEVLADMQKFFDHVKRHLSRRAISARSTGINKNLQDSGRKYNYNPSFMWTGLGK